MDDKSILKLGASPVRLHPERCLNARHHKASCTRCVGSCPGGALRIEGSTVTCDETACIGCGICLSICPMEVFTSRAWSERNILGTLSESSCGRVELLCTRHPEAESETVRSDILKVKVCLASISPGLLFEAGQTKWLDLRVDACRTCSLSCALDHVESSSTLANSWLRAIGKQDRISLSSESAPFVEEKHKRKRLRLRKITQADEEKYSRRAFLTGIGRDSSSLIAAFLGVDPEKVDLVRSKGSPSPKSPHVHRWREALSKAYPTDASGPAVLWPDIVVNESCSVCGLCERYCPSGAIRSHASGHRLERTFTPGLCTDCALCALVCPSEAIARGHVLRDHPFDDRVVLEVEVEYCPQCHAPARKSENHLCHWCASEASVESLLGQARSLLTPTNLQRTADSS